LLPPPILSSTPIIPFTISEQSSTAMDAPRSEDQAPSNPSDPEERLRELMKRLTMVVEDTSFNHLEFGETSLNVMSYVHSGASITRICCR
jgi:hypothetical protein